VKAVRAIEAKWRSPEERLEAARSYVETRLVVCICNLLLRFHLGLEQVARLLDSGEFLVFELVDGELRQVGHDDPPRGERLYERRGAGRDDPEYRVQFAKAVSDIQMAQGILGYVFPNYRGGLPLDELPGGLGDRIRTTLRAAVALQIEAGFFPDYWRSIRFNRSALVLALREVWGSEARAARFLSRVSQCEEVVPGVERALENGRRLRREFDELAARLRQSNEDLAAQAAAFENVVECWRRSRRPRHDHPHLYFTSPAG
jgi:hypothetical protein